MNEGLFFATSMIWSEGTTNYTIALAVTSIVIIGKCMINTGGIRRSVKSSSGGSIPLISIVNENDPQFPQNTLKIIKYFLSIQYPGIDPFSHTNIDIALYCNNKKIVSIIKKLEYAIYSQSTIDVGQAREINSALINFFQ